MARKGGCTENVMTFDKSDSTCFMFLKDYSGCWVENWFNGARRDERRLGWTTLLHSRWEIIVGWASCGSNEKCSDYRYVVKIEAVRHLADGLDVRRSHKCLLRFFPEQNLRNEGGGAGVGVRSKGERYSPTCSEQTKFERSLWYPGLAINIILAGTVSIMPHLHVLVNNYDYNHVTVWQNQVNSDNF